MVTTTYIAAVLVVCVWLWLRRKHSSQARSIGWDWRREIFGGGPDLTDADLVERMATCLVERSTQFGSSYALPGYLGATLPGGLYEAAAANRGQLTAEVLERFAEIMSDRARRGRRLEAEFCLPAGYALNMVLSRGPEAMVASFDPIIDVHAALADAGLAAPNARQVRGQQRPAITAQERMTRATESATSSAGGTTEIGAAGGAVTTISRDAATTTTGAPKGLSFVLAVDKRARAERQLGTGGSSVLLIGRGSGADLRCPAELTKISRLHAALTYAHGKVWVEDRDSSNGTWVQRPHQTPARLSPGQPVELNLGDSVWLDEDHRTSVTCL